jgi:hypothetical protein
MSQSHYFKTQIQWSPTEKHWFACVRRQRLEFPNYRAAAFRPIVYKGHMLTSYALKHM